MQLGHSPEFRRISLAEAQPLRQLVLRPAMRAGDIVVPGDDAAETWHVGMYVEDVLAGIASLYAAVSPHHGPDIVACQIRMFGIDSEFQGQGYAPLLMQHCIDVAQTQGAVLVWGNARLHVAPLYERLGFNRVGEEFDIPGVCRHVYVERFL